MAEHPALRGILNTLLIFFFGHLAQANLDCSKYISEGDHEFALHYLKLLSTSDVTQAENLLQPDLREKFASQKAQLLALAQRIDGAERVTIGCRNDTRRTGWGDSKQINISYEWHVGNEWFLGNVAWTEANQKRTVIGVSINSIPKSLKEMNQFTFAGKGFRHFIFLAMTIGVFSFILYALYSCARTPNLNRKWLWMVFILMGFLSTTLNWTTGELTTFIRFGTEGFSFNPNFILLGAGFQRASEYSPWMLSFAIPVGALVFFHGRRPKVKAP